MKSLLLLIICCTLILVVAYPEETGRKVAIAVKAFTAEVNAP